MNKLLEIDGSDLSDIFPYLKDEYCHYSEFLLVDKPYKELGLDKPPAEWIAYTHYQEYHNVKILEHKYEENGKGEQYEFYIIEHNTKTSYKDELYNQYSDKKQKTFVDIVFKNIDEFTRFFNSPHKDIFSYTSLDRVLFIDKLSKTTTHKAVLSEFSYGLEIIFQSYYDIPISNNHCLYIIPSQEKYTTDWGENYNGHIYLLYHLNIITIITPKFRFSIAIDKYQSKYQNEKAIPISEIHKIINGGEEVFNKYLGKYADLFQDQTDSYAYINDVFSILKAMEKDYYLTYKGMSESDYELFASHFDHNEAEFYNKNTGAYSTKFAQDMQDYYNELYAQEEYSDLELELQILREQCKTLQNQVAATMSVEDYKIFKLKLHIQHLKNYIKDLESKLPSPIW